MNTPIWFIGFSISIPNIPSTRAWYPPNNRVGTALLTLLIDSEMERAGILAHLATIGFDLSEAVGFVGVSNLPAGLKLIEELFAKATMPFAQIVYRDNREEIWRDHKQIGAGKMFNERFLNKAAIEQDQKTVEARKSAMALELAAILKRAKR
jgi:hypothetical protein